ncbi:MAG TPA: hypothetical protein VEG29_01070 [Candidatus Binatia bacterium]|nr:hypothetical protein [Candidatus Binatia bacterium]
MHPPVTRRRAATLASRRFLAAIVALATALVVAGCGGGSSPAATVSPSGAPAPSDAASGPTRIPILVDTQDPVGQTRFLFAMADQKNNPIGAPDLPVTVSFYDTAKSTTVPAGTYPATFVWAITGERGIYVVNPDFSEAGDWIAEFQSTKDGLSERTRVQFQVAATSSTPAVGAKAPSTPTPTLADVGGDVHRISTDQNPDPSFYQVSESDALAQHKPFVLIFATPAFCQSRQCGPTLDAVKAFAKTEPGITYINVEPYKLQYTNGSLQPVFDANGNLQPTDVTNTWGLLSEPWIFVVDKDGIVRGSFSLIFTTDELKAAVTAATQ